MGRFDFMIPKERAAGLSTEDVVDGLLFGMPPWAKDDSDDGDEMRPAFGEDT